MTRDDVTAAIIAAKTQKKLTWKQLADAVGQSPVWTTAALLGQMSLNPDEARVAGDMLDLPADAVALLQTVPSRGSLHQPVPTDPLIYRFYEIVQVYGTTIKTLIEEEFGDGIMSAIDFSLDIQRVADPKGDRVQVTFNGKFLPFKRY